MGNFVEAPTSKIVHRLVYAEGQRARGVNGEGVGPRLPRIVDLNPDPHPLLTRVQGFVRELPHTVSSFII